MEIKIPKVDTPERNLADVFAELMAEAMSVTVDEAKIILKI